MDNKNIREVLIKDYILEDDYRESMKNIIEPYLDSIEEHGTFDGKDNLQIYYKKYIKPDSKGNIVISHGYSEYIEKYDELIYTYINQGYSVFIMEHRGHGRSGNLGLVDKSQVTVNKFEDYVSDFKMFMDKVVMPNSKGKKVFLFAHSMGGAIATKFLEENTIYFDAAILSSPMFKINVGSIPYFMAKIISNVATFCGFGYKYVLGQGKYISIYDMELAGTSSKARYDYNYYRMDSNKIVQRGGVSFTWLKESVKATKSILQEKNIKKISIPILIFQATNDTYVKLEGHSEFIKYARDCKLEVIQGARHDIYTETDKILFPYLKKVLSFYEKNL